MEASEGSGMDCRVGTIVWVRRRNGSWWPGRILGTHELSASHLMSPRSGTPVKLLGREDASVDWYNLEKSKRVKAFRCGEFDACIKRAEASQGIPIKKREKYARREDAILHALELEKQQPEKRQRGSTFNNTGNNSLVALTKKLNSCSPTKVLSRNVSISHDRFVSPKSEQVSSKVDFPLEDAYCGNSLHVQRSKNDKDIIPRMRELQDFGPRIAPSKKKLTTSGSYENSGKAVLVDNHLHVLTGSGHGMADLKHNSNGKNSPAFKMRRSEGVPVEGSLVKRRDRRRPLVQVLQSSAKLPLSHPLMSNSDTVSVTVEEEKEHFGTICHSKRSRCVYVSADSRDCMDPNAYSSDHMQTSPNNMGYVNSFYYPDSVAEGNTSSGVIEGDESDLSERDCLDMDAGEEEILLPASTQSPGSRTSGEYVENGSSSLRVQEDFQNTKNGEEPLSGYRSSLHSHEQNVGTSADVGVSKWHMKGKRNIRSLSKKPIEVMDEKTYDFSGDKFDGSINVTEHESMSIAKMGRERASRKIFCHRSEDYVYDECDFFEKDLDSQPLAYPLMLKAPLNFRGDYDIYNSDEDSPSHMEAEGLQHASQRVCREELDEYYDPVYAAHLNDGLVPMLLDVNIVVQATYQGERVPLVSLMSRLNGKAIIGHPIQIETLEDGSTDLYTCNDAREDHTAVEESAAPPPFWRTGRRTAMQRVPRSHSTPSALDGGETDPIPHSKFEGKPPLNKTYAGRYNYQAKLMRNSNQSMSVKLQKKLLKKVGLSSQKTRTLSSLASRKHNGENDGFRHTRKNNSILDGLIKPDDTVPSVTCVPVKVVFTRILEAVGRPPSAVGCQHVLLTDLVDDNTT